MPPLPFDDPRVPLAAERTLLAWVRTGLALMGFGFVVARFGLFLQEMAAARGEPIVEDRSSVVIGAAMVGLGSLLNIVAAIRHVRLLRRLSSGSVYMQSSVSLGSVVTLLIASSGAALMVYLLRW
jgi:putative membrane protein